MRFHAFCFMLFENNMLFGSRVQSGVQVGGEEGM
jgi:hypothetical protein